ncbi:hypothetical protein FGO68_gene4693 [Halteria grandinella]|uniref:Uncharacterized protein n=1 Tax=Halteria grandinella TaxID=5974 RepID=A0A8J8P102_HALGN|nr:hypothetical protein FGO68_gene4693 [Halteria grandinella]
MSEEGLEYAHEAWLSSHSLRLERSHHQELDKVLVGNLTHIDLSVDDAPHRYLELIHHQLIGYLDELLKDGQFGQFITLLVELERHPAEGLHLQGGDALLLEFNPESLIVVEGLVLGRGISLRFALVGFRRCHTGRCEQGFMARASQTLCLKYRRLRAKIVLVRFWT